MCANAMVWTGPDGFNATEEELREYAASHGICMLDVFRLDDGVYTYLQPMNDDGRCSCWCWADRDEVRSKYVDGLRNVLRWMIHKCENLYFEPDVLDYIESGCEEILVDDIPMPVMGDGRVIHVIDD